MLVLTRKSNQSIMIGDDIEISVLAIMGEKVRIGIEAPRSVPVFRREVYVEIQRGSGRRPTIDARTSNGALETAERAERPALAGEHRERLEHHDRHDHGGRDERQREQREAELALPCACARTRRTRER